MAFKKREYIDGETVITAENLNDIQDAILELEKLTDGVVIVNEASGTVISLPDATKRGFMGFNIYGKTTQDGTPTPDTPVELVSVGDSGSITVNVTGANVEQSMAVATPNGLPGIPVTSGGNYTDANGQQWICDEIDFARGVYVQRVATEELKSTAFIESWDNPGRFAFSNGVNNAYKTGAEMALSNFAVWKPWGLHDANKTVFAVGNGVLYFSPQEAMTVDEVNAMFAEMIASDTPPVIAAQLETPIETPLPEEELAAYAALHTYKDHTTVSNDASAYMELEYVMDAKKYIDSLIISGGSSAGIIDATLE